LFADKAYDRHVFPSYVIGKRLTGKKNQYTASYRTIFRTFGLYMQSGGRGYDKYQKHITVQKDTHPYAEKN
jgi:hypothetical protein